MLKHIKQIMAGAIILTMILSTVGCSAVKATSKESGSATAPAEAKQIVIYSNADEEAIAAMEDALKGAGYSGKYIIQSFGTGELGGKLMTEGTAIEADIITMSSYFIDSAQKKNQLFADLTSTPKPISSFPSYYAPILGNTGALFVNTEVMKSKKLPMPKSIKDLTNPIYKDMISIPDIASSSTAWLMVQAVLSTYGETDGQKILHDLAKNCGPHIEKSGSGPIKKVRAGEVAIGFGLRHQAVADKAAGKPIDFIDPSEGNYSLTESIAVVKKDDSTTKLAQDMAGVIVKNARPALLKIYPVALYSGETVSGSNLPANPKNYSEPLTVELLQKHQALFENAKQ